MEKIGSEIPKAAEFLQNYPSDVVLSITVVDQDKLGVLLDSLHDLPDGLPLESPFKFEYGGTRLNGDQDRLENFPGFRSTVDSFFKVEYMNLLDALLLSNDLTIPSSAKVLDPLFIALSNPIEIRSEKQNAIVSLVTDLDKIPANIEFPTKRALFTISYDEAPSQQLHTALRVRAKSIEAVQAKLFKVTIIDARNKKRTTEEARLAKCMLERFEHFSGRIESLSDKWSEYYVPEVP